MTVPAIDSPLIQGEIILIAVGVLLWLINSLPMAASIKAILNAVVVIAIVVWLLKLFGFWSSVTNFHVGR